MTAVLQQRQDYTGKRGYEMMSDFIGDSGFLESADAAVRFIRAQAKQLDDGLLIPMFEFVRNLVEHDLGALRDHTSREYKELLEAHLEFLTNCYFVLPDQKGGVQNAPVLVFTKNYLATRVSEIPSFTTDPTLFNRACRFLVATYGVQAGMIACSEYETRMQGRYVSSDEQTNACKLLDEFLGTDLSRVESFPLTEVLPDALALVLAVARAKADPQGVIADLRRPHEPRNDLRDFGSFMRDLLVPDYYTKDGYIGFSTVNVDETEVVPTVHCILAHSPDRTERLREIGMIVAEIIQRYREANPSFRQMLAVEVDDMMRNVERIEAQDFPS